MNAVWCLVATWMVSVPPDTSRTPKLPIPPAPSPAGALAVGPRLPALLQGAEIRLDARPVPDTGQRRPRAIEHSDFYYTRLAIHRYASYAIVPLFVTEYALGQSMYNNPPGSSTTRTAHSAVAIGVITLFGLNTITGGWNLWDSRHDETGGVRRYLHAALMLAADVGFAATAAVAPGGRRAVRDPSSKTQHRDVALISMGVALTGYGMMLIWK